MTRMPATPKGASAGIVSRKLTVAGSVPFLSMPGVSTAEAGKLVQMPVRAGQIRAVKDHVDRLARLHAGGQQVAQRSAAGRWPR